MITLSGTFRLYEIFNRHFKNDDDARAAASEIEGLVNTRVMVEKEMLATKQDLRDLRHELKGDIAGVRHDLSLEISNLRATMEYRFQEQLKWIIVLMVGFLSATVAIIKVL